MVKKSGANATPDITFQDQSYIKATNFVQPFCGNVSKQLLYQTYLGSNIFKQENKCILLLVVHIT